MLQRSRPLEAAPWRTHAVQLLSVSQHLNSQHPEGRLVINALMAFAQFERELTSERQLHKIRTTRRRGLWTGGAGIANARPA
jgi:site-specific DNA recombinase